MDQKKLQSSSKYNEYDLDGDGIVSDAELSNMKEIKETETALRKNLAQLRMARYTLIAMGLFTFMMFMPFISIERINALAEISSLFYISGAGIVGAYMGTTAWMNKKQKLTLTFRDVMGGLKKSQRSLKAWGKQKWRTKSGKPSTQGPKATGERYLPEKAIKALSPAEYARSTAAKRKATRAGKQVAKQPKKIARKTRAYRKVT